MKNPDEVKKRLARGDNPQDVQRLFNVSDDELAALAPKKTRGGRVKGSKNKPKVDVAVVEPETAVDPTQASE